MGGSVEANSIAERLAVTPWILQSGYYLQATAEASAEAAFPVPPRRAHDTLQPQDESIIVGYYTSAEVHSPKAARISTALVGEKGVLWQEATVFIVPAQET